MILSGLFLGVSYFQKVVGIPSPIPKTYTSLKIYGASTIDKLQIKNIEVDNTTLQNTIITDSAIWGPNHILLAEFENNLIGGNVANLDSPVTHWQISRRESGSDVLKILNTVPVGTTEFIDYLCQQGKTYIYEVNAINANQISEAFVTEAVEMDFFGYYLVSEDEGLVYKFDLNVTSGANEYAEDVTFYDGFGKYPAKTIGQRKYLKTSVSAICATVDINGQLLQSVEYMNSLRDFITNGKSKIYKTRKGSIHRVFTHNYKEPIWNDAIGQQIQVVTFDIVEDADV